MTRRTTPEAGVLKAVKDYLAARGVLVLRLQTGVLPNPAGRPVRFGTPGAPDLALVLPAHGAYPPGRAGYCECKAGTNRPTALQAAVMAELERRGAAVCVAKGVDDVIHWLDELGV